MNFGDNLCVTRKNKKLSQSQLAQKVGVISITIGRYERNEIKPSIDIASKIAKALDVSLDYLVGISDSVLEKSLVKQINDIQKLPKEDRICVNKLLNAFIKQIKISKIV